MSNNENNFINEELEKIDIEIKSSEELRELGEYLARRLALSSSIRVPLGEKVYSLSLRRVLQGNKDWFLLAASDEAKQKLFGKNYSPALYTAEYNDLFTMEENCQTLLSTFLGHVTGNLRIETLEEEDSKFRLEINKKESE